MKDKVLVSTAYLPPVVFFSFIRGYRNILVEKEENYLKQTYRNRCYILSANGPIFLSVPVLLGSFHKIKIRDIKIDYSRRWQQVHLGALISAYKSSPYFEYYFEEIEEAILKRHAFLLDLNQELLGFIIRSLYFEAELLFTSQFIAPEDDKNDLRYLISPKKNSLVNNERYSQVFSERFGFVPGMSIIDLLFNTGPDAVRFLEMKKGQD